MLSIQGPLLITLAADEGHCHESVESNDSTAAEAIECCDGAQCIDHCPSCGLSVTVESPSIGFGLVGAPNIVLSPLIDLIEHPFMLLRPPSFS